MANVFFCYVSQDKELAHELSSALQKIGLETMDAVLRLGDSLSQRVEQGLRDADYGVIILSHAFFRKPWPRQELDKLTMLEREYEGHTQLLPIWHEISQQDIARFSPTLAGKVGALSSYGVAVVAEEIAEVVRAKQSSVSSGMTKEYTPPMTKGGPANSTTRVDLKQLLQILQENFSDDELRLLCFELAIDYEDLPGSGKKRKSLELISYAQRHAKLDSLVQAINVQRPHLSLRW